MNSLNSNHLDAFFQVAQDKHFTKAAEKLNITQSALSQRIHSLEKDLGKTLIIRSKSGIRLTEEGNSLLRYCQCKAQLEQEVLNEINHATDEIRTTAGTIRIGGFSSVMRSLVLPKISPILNENPSVQLKMITKEIYELKELLKSGEIDFAVTYEPLEITNCIATKIGEELNQLVQHKKYTGPDVYLDHNENDEITKKVLKRKQLKINERMFLDDVYGLIDGVKNKLGYAVIPVHLIKNEKDIIPVSPAKTLKIPIYLNYYQQSYYTQLHHLVVASLKKLI